MQSISNKNSMKNKRFHPYNKKGHKKPEDVSIEQNIEKNVQQIKIFDGNQFSLPYARAVIRLLARRYALTSKKYVEVGIAVKNDTSNVEIALGEIYKKEIIFDWKDWKKFMSYKSIIIEYFVTGNRTKNAMDINPKTSILLDTYKDIKIIYILNQNKNALILAESTFMYLTKLENCIKCYYKNLSNISETLDEKIDILKNIKDIKNHESFDKSSIFDNELLALYFNNKQ